MICKNCGAAVVGKYCSCCGKRIRNDYEEFKRAERKAQQEFKRNAVEKYAAGMPCGLMVVGDLATACWNACKIKYFGGVFVEVYQPGNRVIVPDEAYEMLEKVKKHATALLDRLVMTDF